MKERINFLIRIALIVTILSVLCVDLAAPVMASSGMPGNAPGVNDGGSQATSAGTLLGLLLGAGGVMAFVAIVVVGAIVYYLFVIKPKRKKTEIKKIFKK